MYGLNWKKRWQGSKRLQVTHVFLQLPGHHPNLWLLGTSRNNTWLNHRQNQENNKANVSFNENTHASILKYNILIKRS